MRYKYELRQVDKATALEMVSKYHYSNTLPKINKYFLGFYTGGYLVGLMTLGYGVQPLGTIRKLFPSLESKDYLEIGRMCMTEEMPRNSESQMIKLCCKWLKENTDIKILFTWADGMQGKCGYVYQASNFNYVGYAMTDIYVMDGIKIHPRQTRALLSPNDKRVTVRPNKEQMAKYGIEHYKGKQFKYFKYLCSKKDKKLLNKQLLVGIMKYPKESDLIWYKQVDGKWIQCHKPIIRTDTTAEEILRSKYEE